MELKRFQSRGNYNGSGAGQYVPPYPGDPGSPSYPGNPSYQGNGQYYQDPNAMPLEQPAGSQGRASFMATLNRRDLAVLGSHDIVIMVDKSGSMDTPDCPGFAPGLPLLGMVFGQNGLGGGGGITRWDWCREKALN